MIGNSIPEYIFIRICIFLLRAVVPCSVLYIAYTLCAGQPLLSWWLQTYAIVESAFYFFVYFPRYYHLQKAANHPPILSRKEREALFQRCADYVSGADYPTGWFTSTDLRRDNVVEWLLWALFSCTREEYIEEWEEEIECYIGVVESVLGRKIGHGLTKTTQSMRLTVDPVVMVHRPLIWYMIVAIVDVVTHCFLSVHGFHHFSVKKWFIAFPPRPLTLLSRPSVNARLSYWYRPHTSKSKSPILFVHGIGIGLWPYLAFISELISQEPEVGILAIELLPISSRITSAPTDRHITCESISAILDSLGLDRIVVMSHSYGTIVTGHMFHSALASRITAALFVDPIPFLLHLPDVAFNFVYRTPRNANEWQLWYFASRDPDISRSLSRHFFWSENILWKEDVVGKRVGVVLSGADQIVDAEEVRKYLTGETNVSEHWSKDTLDVLFYPGLDHATVFDTKDRRRPVIQLLCKYVAEVPEDS